MELEKFDLEKAKAGRKVVTEEEIYVNLYEGYDKQMFLPSLKDAVIDQQNATNPHQYLGTYKLVKV